MNYFEAIKVFNQLKECHIRRMTKKCTQHCASFDCPFFVSDSKIIHACNEGIRYLSKMEDDLK